MQKPLTLDEMKNQKAVWIEDSCEDYGEELFPAICRCKGYPNHSVFATVIEDCEDAWYSDECYNIDWRCWLKHPTEAERKAAKWDV